MLILLLLICFCPLQVSALQCHNITHPAKNDRNFSMTTSTCGPWFTCLIALSTTDQNINSVYGYYHNCGLTCSDKWNIKLEMSVPGDASQTCTFEKNVWNNTRLQCQCMTNLCNELGSPLHNLMRTMYKALSGYDIYDNLPTLPRPAQSIFTSLTGRLLDNNAVSLNLQKSILSADMAPRARICQNVQISGNGVTISEQSTRYGFCAINFRTTTDLKRTEYFGHFEYSLCIYMLHRKKIYTVDGDPTQTCTYYVQDNKEGVYCDCSSDMCNAMNSPLHQLFKRLVEKATGRNISYYVNYPTFG